MAVLFYYKNLSGECMAIYTAFPHDHPPTVLCVICAQTVALSQTTAGSLRADGTQAFACDSHLLNRPAWITVWALFDAQQESDPAILSEATPV